MSLRIDERANGGVMIVDLHGRITAGEVTIRNAIQSLVARGLRRVVLNFSAVSYMDSMGLSTLVQSHLTLRQYGGTLVLLNVPRQIAAVLAATRLTSLFEVFDNETAAIRRLATVDPDTAPVADRS